MTTVPEDFNSPFQPYQIQQDFMKNLYRVLDNNKIGIFESPTGTGKSLSLICASLRFVNDNEERILNEIKTSIEVLNREILSCIDNSKDWIDEQYQMIQKKQKLFELQTKFDKIKEYNLKIDKIRNKIYEKERKIFAKSKEIEENFISDDEDKEAEDFLINDFDSDSEEETIEDKISEDFQPLQVFFCSRTHSQLTQLVGEVKSTVYSKNLRSVSLASRQNYCINKSVRRLGNNNLINEMCLELQKSKKKVTDKDSEKNPTKSRKIATKSCEFYKKNLESLKNLSLTKVMDIEELVKAGTEEKSCPYYSSRAAVKDSQLIFLPYQILFSKSTRDQCGIKLKDSIVIIDEAHNLLDTVSQIHTAVVSLDQLRTCHKQLINYKLKYCRRFAAKNLLKFNQLIFIAKQLLKFLETSDETFKTFELFEFLTTTNIFNIDFFDLLNFCEQTKFAQKIHGFSKIHERLKVEEEIKENEKKNSTKNLLKELQEKSKKKKIEEVKVEEEILSENQPNVIRGFLQFLECLAQRYEGGRILISDKTMKFFLLDASDPFQDIIRDCRSIVLAGGTMKPTDELTEHLFKNCKDRVEIHSFGHVVPRTSILPIALSHGCSGKEFLFTHVNKDSEIMINEAATTIKNLCSIVPGGVICFFTSYENLNRFHSFMTAKKIIDLISTKKDIYVEPRNSSKTEKILEDYAKSIKDRKPGKTGAIILSVIGGKLSEGMNFSDELGRCVIVIGLPFPNKTNPELVEKINFINKNLSPSAGADYYENLCMKAVNQSIGRSIRHIGDFATVILMDSRYHRQNIVKKLPDWIKENLVMEKNYGKVHGEVAKFFREKTG